MFLKEEDNSDYDDDLFYFTLATPFLEKDDEHITFTDMSNAASTSSRKPAKSSRSDSQMNSDAEKWDAKELVTEKVLQRKQVKDVRGAATRLLNFEEEAKLNVQSRGQQNPVYSEPVYGTENIEKSSKHTDEHHTEQDASFYLPTVKLPKTVNPNDFVYGKEAYQLYLSNKRQLDRLEKEEIEPQISLLRQRLIEKRDRIDDALYKAKEYYSSQYEPKKSLQGRFQRIKEYLTDAAYTGPKILQKGFSRADIRLKLEALPLYTPWFIHTITVIQAIAIAMLCASSGVVPPRLASERLLVEEIVTWSGVRTIEHFVPPNMWAGPSREKLVKGGALYAPCLRNDKHFLLRDALYSAKESELGCCEATGRGAGTTTQQECEEIQNLFEVREIQWKNVTCSKRTKSTGVYVRHDFKPCCLGGKGQCILVSHKHCVILGGTWHISGLEHCSQSRCGHDVCSPQDDGGVHSEEEKSGSQFWRIPLSLIYHEGIIHMVLFAILQCYIGIKIEKVAGWLKMAAMYFLCGIGGLLLGSVIVPYIPNLGSGGAISGLISIHTIELLQSWPLVGNKLKAVARVVLLYTIILGLGLLPGVNQFTNMAGALFGVPCSVLLMPYIPFTQRHRVCMIALRIASGISLVVFTSILTYLFYVTQPNITSSIRYFNCLTFIPYACEVDLP